MVAVGAITNVSNAILIEPTVIRNIVVVWLGGNGHHWPHQREFNFRQDLSASAIIFDSGVPFVQLPCTPIQVPTVIGWLRPAILAPAGVISGLSVAELEACGSPGTTILPLRKGFRE